MTAVPERDVAAFVRDRGARILDVDRTSDGGPVRNRIYYVTRDGD